MKTLVIVVAVVVLLVTGCSKSQRNNLVNKEREIKGNVRLAAPSQGAYTGAYVDFGDYEDDVTLEAIEEFEELVGKKQALIASSSYWGRNVFPKKNLEIIAAYGAVPLVFWNPWDRDEWSEKKYNRFNLYSILKGEHDTYIDMWADGAKAHGKPILLAWGIEMNGNWFPWSGIFHGGGKLVANSNPAKYEGPKNFIRTYKYIVDRFRARGVSNVEWVFHANNTSDPYEPWWNNMANYYPGSDYVDWLAMSAYGQQYPNVGWIEFKQSFHPFYEELLKIDSSKPVILGEWGVGHFPESGSQAKWIGEAIDRFSSSEFPRLKGAIYWHERWQNGDESYSNLRLTADDTTVEVYKDKVANPFWVARPEFQAR
ncbi:MAG: beta-mannanase [Deltaproteobacteria bacterium]|nr:beta-mannanase [Deltaproteobacteria bacterium]